MERTLDFSLTCCFTGHRVIAINDKEKLISDLEKTVEELIKKGVKHFICGGAIGFDTLAAQTILKMKEKYDVLLEIAVPCRDQDAKWNKKQQAEYQKILKSADKVTVLFEKYVTGCMHYRDAFMVDNSDILVSYYRGRNGGTQYTFLYAESRGLKVINL